MEVVNGQLDHGVRVPEAVAVLGLAVGLVDAAHIDLDVEFDQIPTDIAEKQFGGNVQHL
jgi:hypothetical protein